MNNIIHNTNIHKSMGMLRRIFPIILGDDKINGTEVIALKHISQISRTESINSSEIFEFMWTNKSAVSQMLNSLEQNGYVVRSRSKVDRRKIDIAITEKGLHIVDKVDDMKNSLNRKIYDKFSEEKVLLLEQMLDDYGVVLGECLQEIKQEKGENDI